VDRVAVDKPYVLKAAIGEVVHRSLSFHIDHGNDNKIGRWVLHRHDDGHLNTSNKPFHPALQI